MVFLLLKARYRERDVKSLKMHLFALLYVVLWSAYRGNAYFVTVDAHAEECFFDHVGSGTKLGLTFEVAEGGFLDIDVEVFLLALYSYYVLYHIK